MLIKSSQLPKIEEDDASKKETGLVKYVKIFLDWQKKILQSKIKDVRSLFENKEDYYRLIKSRVAFDEYYLGKYWLEILKFVMN